MSTQRKRPTDGGSAMGQQPFAGLNLAGLPAGPAVSPEKSPSAVPPGAEKSRGRVDIVRQTAGRGGKTVTVASGFVGIGLAEKERLAKQIQKACGCGGTVKEGSIEIQGDQREVVARVLRAAGFKPVLAGG